MAAFLYPDVMPTDLLSKLGTKSERFRFLCGVTVSRFDTFKSGRNNSPAAAFDTGRGVFAVLQWN